MDAELILLTDDPVATAKAAKLRYVDCEGPGIRRKRWGRGFTFLDEEGNHITDPERRQRFEELAIPPAWTEVWICPYKNGHIQVTGRDNKGRKQYIYHPRWQEVRSATKFNRMVLLGDSLPDLRMQIDSDLRKHGAPRERVLAAVVRLLQETLIRVGNPEYARANESYGLTTMLGEHVEMSGNLLHFEFKGKSGKTHQVDVRDPRVARVIRQLQELPGQELFQWVDGEGHRHTVGSSDVNEYVRMATGRGFTAKDFRTWGGTVHAVRILKTMGPQEDEKATQKRIVELYKLVAEELGNTPAVCREYYVHPAVVAAFQEGTLFELAAETDESMLEQDERTRWLALDELLTLRVLRHTLAQNGQ